MNNSPPIYRHILPSGFALFLITSLSWLPLLHAQDKPLPVVTTQARISTKNAHPLTLTGTVTSPKRSLLSARTTGLITEINVDAGSNVKEGDTLLTLDAKLARLTLKQIEAQIAQAEIIRDDAQRKVDEVAKLIKTGGFPKSEALTRQTTLNVSQANIEQLNTQKELQLENISRHNLLAPFAGTIVSKRSEAGEWVATGTPVLELISLDNLRFDVQVPQEFLTPIKNIGEINIQLDAYPDTILTAKLLTVLPVKDEISRTFLTRFIIEDPNKISAPGMSGKANINQKSNDNTTITVPRDAIVRLPDGTTKVWIVESSEKGHRVTSRLVETAGDLQQNTTITKGLEGNETIVLKGNESLRENQPVEILQQPTTSQNQTP